MRSPTCAHTQTAVSRAGKATPFGGVDAKRYSSVRLVPSRQVTVITGSTTHSDIICLGVITAGPGAGSYPGEVGASSRTERTDITTALLTCHSRSAPVAVVLRRALQRLGHHGGHLFVGDCPGPAGPRHVPQAGDPVLDDRARHRPTGCGVEPSWAATSLFDAPLAQARVIRHRTAHACGVNRTCSSTPNRMRPVSGAAA